jgi:hypothetical protein
VAAECQASCNLSGGLASGSEHELPDPALVGAASDVARPVLLDGDDDPAPASLCWPPRAKRKVVRRASDMGVEGVLSRQEGQQGTRPGSTRHEGRALGRGADGVRARRQKSTLLRSTVRRCRQELASRHRRDALRQPSLLPPRSTLRSFHAAIVMLSVLAVVSVPFTTRDETSAFRLRPRRTGTPTKASRDPEFWEPPVSHRDPPVLPSSSRSPATRVGVCVPALVNRHAERR